GDGSEAEALAHVRRIDLAKLALGADDAAEDGGVGHVGLLPRIQSSTILDAGRSCSLAIARKSSLALLERVRTTCPRLRGWVFGLSRTPAQPRGWSRQGSA